MKVMGNYILDKAVDLVESIKRESFVRKLYFAKSGNSDAQLEIGNMYLNGYGIDTDDNEAVMKNDRKAFYWFFKSSEQNNAEAFFCLAFCFFEGVGVQKNNEKAIYFLHKAAKLGNVDSMLKLYEIYGAKNDFEKAISFAKVASENGNSLANYMLGYSYMYRDEIGINIEKGLKYLVDAAESENKNAQSLLGILYFSGDKLHQDYKKSLYYLEKAASKDDILAISTLAMCHENGYGTKKDVFMAIHLYTRVLDLLLSIDSKSFPGLFDKTLSEIAKYKDLEYIENCIDSPVVFYYLSQEFIGFDKEQNPEKYIYFLKKSAEMGYDKAQYELGKMYETGLHVEKNIDKAIEWFEKAGEQGDDGAIYSLLYLKDPDFFKSNNHSKKD